MIYNFGDKVKTYDSGQMGIITNIDFDDVFPYKVIFNSAKGGRCEYYSESAIEPWNEENEEFEPKFKENDAVRVNFPDGTVSYGFVEKVNTIALQTFEHPDKCIATYTINISGLRKEVEESLLQPCENCSNSERNTEDAVNHPNHYMCHEMECIDEMIALFGVDETKAFCKLCAWKYRYRAGSKGSAEEDQKKSDWYIKKYKELDDYGKLPEF